MPFINLTPHQINIFGDCLVPVIPPSGEILRVSQRTVPENSIGGVAIVRTTYGPLQLVRYGVVLPHLPPVVPGTLYIVSAMCADRIRELRRTDFVSPGDPVRNDAGQVIGCSNLRCI